MDVPSEKRSPPRARSGGKRQKVKTPNGGQAVNPRRDDIIKAAAECFANTGYDATAMRDIAKRTGILAGSIYYHFKSKEEILVAVHEEAVRRIRNKVLKAIDPEADAWTRLVQASTAYAESLVSERKFAEVIITEFPRRRSRAVREQLVSHRDEFEQIFRDIVEDLPLAPWVDRSIWRLALLSELAWTMIWYRKGGKTAAEIAEHLVALLRYRTAAAD